MKRVSSFLSEIPNEIQAKASLFCGGLVRALLHWELAYGEDSMASQAAHIGGAAFFSFSPDIKTSSGQINNRIGNIGVNALQGLLDTYASLHDSDG